MNATATLTGLGMGTGGSTSGTNKLLKTSYVGAVADG